MEEDESDRVLFLEIDGVTYVARDCHDIDGIEERVGFTYCPICGGKRKIEGGVGYLDHDPNYTGAIH
jgi:hypothetical protein